ncbi:MAG: pantetheine-phosphate adenylyltransferase [Chlorobi bacterium]|nr:pantetheine-phosphate adenylyltransferase [Chlorobiota bacterium]MCI0717337.1 pantetheine-phosphate adenylyltransferase [Chlorobiota bacterium]
MHERIAIYPGTFDPVTYGHIDVLKRASKLFDKIIISVGESSSKSSLFTVDQRIKMLSQAVSDIKNAEVDSFSGLLVDYAKKKKASAVIRGLRAVSDFEYEFQMALTNQTLEPDVETVFLTPSQNYSFISSSLVKEIAKNGGDVSYFVPKIAEKMLKEKFGSNH